MIHYFYRTMVHLQDLNPTIFLIICLLPVICKSSLEPDRQWDDGEVSSFCAQICDEECTFCTTPKKCTEGQTKCGEEPPKEHPDCPPDEICVPKGCNCKYQ